MVFWCKVPVAALWVSRASAVEELGWQPAQPRFWWLWQSGRVVVGNVEVTEDTLFCRGALGRFVPCSFLQASPFASFENVFPVCTNHIGSSGVCAYAGLFLCAFCLKLGSSVSVRDIAGVEGSGGGMG